MCICHAKNLCTLTTDVGFVLFLFIFSQSVASSLNYRCKQCILSYIIFCQLSGVLCHFILLNLVLYSLVDGNMATYNTHWPFV